MNKITVTEEQAIMVLKYVFPNKKNESKAWHEVNESIIKTNIECMKKDGLIQEKSCETCTFVDCSEWLLKERQK